jgi:molecular chaperone GrpE
MDKKKTKEKVEEEEVVEPEEVKESTEVEELEEQVAAAENKYKRALADYQNLQKRVQDERQDWIKITNRELLLRLLPILDTLLLANQHAKDEGLKVIINQFLAILKAEEVTKIDTVGKEFDPELMEVITTGEGEDGKVLDEIRTGFMIYDKLLRPAQVRVGKKN